MSTDFDTLLQRYLDGELTEAEIQRFTALAREDLGARRAVTAYDKLETLLAGLREAGPPPVTDPVARTMARIATRPMPRRPLWRRLADQLTASPLRLAGAGAVVMAAGVLVGLGVARIGPEEVAPTDAPIVARAADPAGAAPAEVFVHFVLASPEAERVSVVGDFNGWDPFATPLERVGDVWRAAVPLPPGRYEYQFVVDGETWVVDPAAPRTVDDGFGGRNGVLEV